MVYEPFEKYGIQFRGWKIEFHFEKDIFTVWNMNLTLFIYKKFNLNHNQFQLTASTIKEIWKTLWTSTSCSFLNFNIYQKIFYIKNHLRLSHISLTVNHACSILYHAKLPAIPKWPQNLKTSWVWNLKNLWASTCSCSFVCALQYY